MTPDERRAVVDAMRKYGGSFAKAIALAWEVADQQNRYTLEVAFETLFESYRSFPAVRIP